MNTWKSGVVKYEVNFIDRYVDYYGANVEEYKEIYPAVEINHIKTYTLILCVCFFVRMMCPKNDYFLDAFLFSTNFSGIFYILCSLTCNLNCAHLCIVS